MILLGRYELLKGYGEHHVSVGFGSYGQVKLAVDKKTGENVAVKIVHKLAKNEVVFQGQLYHPSIIQLLGHYIDRERETTYMILEYADGGTLFDKLREQVLEKPEIKRYFQEVCQAVAYLHENEIMHRDIKPENILLSSQNRAKLCDFGFAAILGERKTLCGTYEYMSPEMVQNKPYDYKIDVWALGILLFEMISGKAPFKGNSPQEVLSQMKTKIFFNDRFTSEEINLIKSILRVTPHKRPTIKEILEHPYFSDPETLSTKESELETSRLDSSMARHLPETKKQPQFKPQQNSYPFYLPKNQPTRTESNFEFQDKNPNFHHQQHIYSSNKAQYYPLPPKSTLNTSSSNLNTSYSSMPSPQYGYRKS